MLLNVTPKSHEGKRRGSIIRIFPNYIPMDFNFLSLIASRNLFDTIYLIDLFIAHNIVNPMTCLIESANYKVNQTLAYFRKT